MANATKKALALARVMVDNLTLRFASLGTPEFVAQGVDATGNPLIAVGPTAAKAALTVAGTAQTAGEQNIIIKIIPWPSLGTDSLGNAQNSYTPHKIQIGEETSGTAGVSVVTEVNQMVVLGEALRTGCTTELYMRTNGTAPVPADITAANLVASYDSMIFPGVGTV